MSLITNTFTYCSIYLHISVTNNIFFIFYTADMEDRCTTVSTLTEKSSEWMIKVILIEKTNIFPGKDHNTFQRFVFADEQVNSTLQICRIKKVSSIEINILHPQIYLSSRFQPIDNHFLYRMNPSRELLSLEM